MGFLARSVSFEKVSAVLDTLHPLFVDLCSCFGMIASCVIESAVSNIVDARLGGGIRQGEVVIEDIPSSEHGGKFEAPVDTTSLPSGSVCSDAVQPSRTSVSIQAMPEVHEVKNVSVGTEPVSKTSVGVQCSLAPEESTNVFAPAESRGSLYATATEGNTPSQMMNDPESFSVPTVSSEYNLYTLAETMSFPSVDDLRKSTDFERLREDVRGFGYESEGDGSMAPSLPVTELGVSPPPSTSTPTSPRPVRAKPLEYFRECWVADTKHLWSREFWYRVLRSEELIKTVYEEMLPLDEGATDEDKYEMEVGEGLVSIVSTHICIASVGARDESHLAASVQRSYDDAGHNDSLFVSAEANQTAASSAASIGVRSLSPFVRPSNPQSRFLESSCEVSVTAPTIQNGTPSPSRRRPALAQITNTPRGVLTTPSRTPVKAGRVQGVLYGVPTPPTSVRPKLAKHGSRFPLITSTTRLKDESDSPTRPARHCPPPSKFPRWRG
ncbi:hypothetical protein ARMGADRAFT_1073863 [Armillaria gallica]|uniref:Uncharacterized protein n=1 Tax=Armillaria gallica TaxID=47427 RepID=A0A2H3DUP9_ARMGA|nr:hypothetical protein ARMGADRAFT_1073863 [Armillaria gallica]